MTLLDQISEKQDARNFHIRFKTQSRFKSKISGIRKQMCTVSEGKNDFVGEKL